VDTPWIVGPVRSRYDELVRKVERAAYDAGTGLLATRTAPALLGEGTPRRYLVVFVNPAEARASGGIVGNFVEMSATEGALEKVRSGRDRALNTEGLAGRTLVGPEDYVTRYARFAPDETWQNTTMSPDWPSVAEVMEGLYPQSGGGPVDGVISVDPIALGAFLELTGPVDVAGLAFPVDVGNVAAFLLRDQYTQFPDDVQREAVLDQLVDAVFDRITSGDLPGPARIGEVLGPMVRAGRLRLHSTRPDEQALFRRMHADSTLPRVRHDFVGVTTQNAAGNKIDVFLTRRLDYQVRLDPDTARLRATVTVTLRNDAPTTGLPPTVIEGFGDPPRTQPGENLTFLSAYTPWTLESATLDGTAIAMERATERARRVYSAFVRVPAGETVRVQLRLTGELGEPGEPGRYRLDLWGQALVDPEVVRARVAVVEGWSLEGRRGLQGSGLTLAARWRGPGEHVLVAAVAGG
jgi:hypothetical protein